MTEKFLGKISEIYFGMGGYQEAMIGVGFTFEGEGLGVSDFWGFWASAPSPSAQWSKLDQATHLGEVTLRIAEVLKKAKVAYVHQLAGKPVEVIINNNALSSWRILEEVL